MTQVVLFINPVPVCVLDIDVHNKINKNSKSLIVVHAGPGFTKTALQVFKF